MRTCLLLLSAIFCGCTIKVEPIAKPKPKVKYKTKVVYHHRKAHAHGTPAPHGMIAPDEPTKLIEHPTPQP